MVDYMKNENALSGPEKCTNALKTFICVSAAGFSDSGILIIKIDAKT
jgi:hypothetical protein